jgi:hypothetical protein
LGSRFPMARMSAEAPALAERTPTAKLILPAIEWRKRPVKKDASPDAGHRVTPARWTVMKPSKPLEMEANYPDDSHLITFPLVAS